LRITHQTSSETVIRYLRKQTWEIVKTQEKIASGKEISQPSDNPQGMAQILNTQQLLSSLEQFQRNITQAELRISAIETTLSTIDELIATAQEIVASAEYESELDTAMADQVALIRDQVIQLANTQVGDTYLFAGHSSTTAPFLADGTYTGDGGALQVRIGQNLDTTLQVDGDTVFKATADIFAILEDLETALRNGDSLQVQNQAGSLAQFEAHLQTVRAEIGFAMDQMETSLNYLSSFTVKMENYLADLEGADLTEAAVELEIQTTVYEAALSAAADLLQTNLLQFLG
jgi:flagellar hook-associated protein 3 FlgL